MEINNIHPPKNKKVSKLSYLIRILVSIGMFYLSTIGGNMLTRIIPTLGFVFPIIVLSLCLGYWMWVLTNRIVMRRPLGMLIRVISIFLVVAATWLSMPLYVDYLPQQETIEFKRPYYDSTQVVVHFGTRPNDFFYTQKTVGELKQKSSVALIVNGQPIFNIYTDGRQIFVDAILFAGYTNQIVNNYTTIGSTDNFSLQMSGYFNTNIPGTYEKKSFSDAIKNKALAPPVTIIDSALSRNPDNKWNIWRSNVGFEVTNENNIPVLVLEYKNPYDITISGLFATPFGILKVDNSKDIIFEFGDSPFDLGIYTVDRLMPHSIFDLFRPDRTYVLSETGR